MAQEILVKDVLEREKIAAGKDLLQRLSQTDFKIVAAFWLWTMERNEWRLVVSSPWQDKHGPLKSYRKIRETLAQPPELIAQLRLPEVLALDTKKPLIKALRAYAKKYRTNLAGERLRDYWLDHVSVDDSYIYFVK